jgi:hypothetical protein
MRSHAPGMHASERSSGAPRCRWSRLKKQNMWGQERSEATLGKTPQSSYLRVIYEPSVLTLILLGLRGMRKNLEYCQGCSAVQALRLYPWDNTISLVFPTTFAHDDQLP